MFDKLGLPSGKRTKTGYSTDASVLGGLAGAYPIAGKVLEYRELTKLRSTYIEALPRLVGEDGRLHTSFNQTVAATGRLSSSNPNLQNIPVRTPLGLRIRAAFVPPVAGDLMVSADYSQIELRVLAHLSQDAGLIEAFTSGRDFHAATASRVFAVDAADVTPEMRRRAKAVNFGIVYGRAPTALRETLNIGYGEAQEMIDRYFAAYPQVRSFLDRTVAEAHRDGFAVTMFGRRRPIPELASSNFNLRSFGERTAMNHPMQGSAADIMKLAMIEVDRRLRSEGFASRMVLQVHDELVFEAPPAELDRLSGHGARGDGRTSWSLLCRWTSPWAPARTGQARNRTSRRGGIVRGRILVVDDEAAIREVVRLNLEAEGYDVACAEDAACAMAAFAAERFDLAILDVMLPDSDGFELARAIRERSDIPIMMLSARDADIDKAVGLGVGADDYVTKPFSPIELIARVKAHLRRYAAGSAGVEGYFGEGARAGEDIIAVGAVSIDLGRRKVVAGAARSSSPRRSSRSCACWPSTPDVSTRKRRSTSTCGVRSRSGICRPSRSTSGGCVPRSRSIPRSRRLSPRCGASGTASRRETDDDVDPRSSCRRRVRSGCRRWRRRGLAQARAHEPHRRRSRRVRAGQSRAPRHAARSR